MTAPVGLIAMSPKSPLPACSIPENDPTWLAPNPVTLAPAARIWSEPLVQVAQTLPAPVVIVGLIHTARVQVGDNAEGLPAVGGQRHMDGAVAGVRVQVGQEQVPKESQDTLGSQHAAGNPPPEPVAIVPPVHVAPESVLCAANNPLPLAMFDTTNNRNGLVGSIATAPSL